LRQNINQLVEKGGFQLSDAVLMHSKRISSGQKKVKIIPIIISKRLFSGRLVLLFVVDVACGRMMSHFGGILISVDGRFCGTRTQEGGWVGLAPGKGLGGWFRMFKRLPRFWPRTSAPPSRRRTQYRCRRPCCCTPCQSRCTRSPSCTQTPILV